MPYDKTNLVICKQGFTTETETFKEGEIYRTLSEQDQWLIYGVVFNQESFDKFFEFAYDVVMREWTELGLIKDGKPVSKKVIKELVNIHKYVYQGGGRGNYLNVGYVYEHPKVLSYQFGAIFKGDNKTSLIKQIHFRLERFCSGDVEDMDSNWSLIIRGNSGIPISGGNIRWRPLKESLNFMEYN